MIVDEKSSVFNLTVRYNETDAMGVVNNARYLDWLSESRVCWIKDRGHSYRQWEDDGIHLPLVEVQVKYRQSAFFEDELQLFCTCQKLSLRGMDFSYQLYRHETLLAEAKSRHIFLVNGHAARISEDFYCRLANYRCEQNIGDVQTTLEKA